MKALTIFPLLLVINVASAESGKPLTIEGKPEKSAIETMTLPPIVVEEDFTAPIARPRFEDPTTILDEPEELLGIGEKGLPLPIETK